MIVADSIRILVAKQMDCGADCVSSSPPMSKGHGPPDQTTFVGNKRPLPNGRGSVLSHALNVSSLV